MNEEVLELQSNKNEEIMENTNNNEILITDEELNNCKINFEDGTYYVTPNPLRGPKGEPGIGGTNMIYDSEQKALTIELF